MMTELRADLSLKKLHFLYSLQPHWRCCFTYLAWDLARAIIYGRL